MTDDRLARDWGTCGRDDPPSPPRPRCPTLDASDLWRIVDAADTRASGSAPRYRALVALHCFSCPRPEEIVRLRWEDLATELTASGTTVLQPPSSETTVTSGCCCPGQPQMRSKRWPRGGRHCRVPVRSGPPCARSAEPTAQLSGSSGRTPGRLSPGWSTGDGFGRPACRVCSLAAQPGLWIDEVAAVLGLGEGAQRRSTAAGPCGARCAARRQGNDGADREIA